MKTIILSIVLGILSLSAKSEDLDRPELEIRKVIEKFRLSLINKDKKALNSLIYRDDIPFIAVFSKEMLEVKRKNNPDYPGSADFGQHGGRIDSMISNDKEQEEKIFDIKVLASDSLGSVSFSYEDHYDGSLRAWGKEHWSLIKVENVWKIISITFTVTEVTPEFKDTTN